MKDADRAELAREKILELAEASLGVCLPKNSSVSIDTMDELHALTQDQSLLSWIEEMTVLHEEGSNPAPVRVIDALAQLNEFEKLMSAMIGYLTFVRQKVRSANQNLLGVGYLALRLQGETTFTIDDGTTGWQLYLSPSAPESSVFRVTPQKRKRKRRKR